MEEMDVIRTLYKANEKNLGGTFTNQNTNKDKQEKWEEIAAAVSALGYSTRTPADIKAKWKSMKTDAKKAFTKFNKARSSTGGGPPPKAPNANTMRTIDMMKDHTSFKGISGGIDTFSDPVCQARLKIRSAPTNNFSPRATIVQRNSISLFSPIGTASSSSTSTTTVHLVASPAVPTNKKQQNSAVTVQERQMKVLREEEDLSRQKMVNLKLQQELTEMDIRNKRKKRLMLDMELSLLEKKKRAKENNSSDDSSEDGIFPN